MSLGLATVIVALMVAPGIVMLLAAITALRVSRDLGNTAMTLTLGAAMALFVHLAAALFGRLVWALAAADLPPGTEPELLGRLLRSIGLMLAGAAIGPGDLLNLMLYAAYAVIVGAVLGYAFGRAVVEHTIELPIFHGPFYRYTRRNDDRVVYASVLTKTEIGGKPLLYVGVLNDLTRGPGGAISDITLFAPYKSLFSEGPEGMVTSPRQDIEDETQDPANLLHIGGSEIANLVLSTQRLAVP